MSDQKKVSSGVAVFLLIIVFLLLGTVIFLLISKNAKPNTQNNIITDKNDNTNENTGNNTSKDTNNTIDKAKVILLDEVSKIVNNELSILDNKKSLELSNNDKLWIFYNLLPTQQPGELLQSFSETDLMNAFNKSSINNMGLNHQNIIDDLCGKAMYIYDNKNHTYTYDPLHAHGGSKEVTAAFTKFESLTNKSNQYVLVAKKAFVSSQMGTTPTKVYGSYLNAKNDTNVIYTAKNASNLSNNNEVIKLLGNEIEQNYATYKDSLATYTYTFEKINGKITLVDFKVD